MNKDQVPMELALEYARCVDEKCFDELDRIMSHDVIISAPDMEWKGVAAFKKQLQILHDYSRTMHLVGNQRGQWNGDEYSGETYCVASHIYERDGVGRKWEVGVRYKDDIALSDGSYRFTRRYLDVLWQSDAPLQG